jgi:hypothetical protein
MKFSIFNYQFPSNYQLPITKAAALKIENWKLSIPTGGSI